VLPDNVWPQEIGVALQTKSFDADAGAVHPIRIFGRVVEEVAVVEALVQTVEAS
jgi:hypothetical protein